MKQAPEQLDAGWLKSFREEFGDSQTALIYHTTELDKTVEEKEKVNSNMKWGKYVLSSVS